MARRDGAGVGRPCHPKLADRLSPTSRSASSARLARTVTAGPTAVGAGRRPRRRHGAVDTRRRGHGPTPGPARPRPRERVIDAAVELFAGTASAGTSLQMIADHLGVTKAAVYYQFHAKEDIVLAVLEDARRAAARLHRDVRGSAHSAGGDGGRPRRAGRRRARPPQGRGGHAERPRGLSDPRGPRGLHRPDDPARHPACSGRLPSQRRVVAVPLLALGSPTRAPIRTLWTSTTRRCGRRCATWDASWSTPPRPPPEAPPPSVRCCRGRDPRPVSRAGDRSRHPGGRRA